MVTESGLVLAGVEGRHRELLLWVQGVIKDEMCFIVCGDRNTALHVF